MIPSINLQILEFDMKLGIHEICISGPIHNSSKPLANMCKKVVAILVAFFAVFFGEVWYNAYLPISSELKGDQKLVPFLFNINNLLSKVVGEKLAIAPRCKVFRWLCNTLSKMHMKLSSEGVTFTDSVIAGVPVKIFKPVPENSNGESKLRPGLIHFHGGGFLLGSVHWDSYMLLCIMLARSTKSVVISVEYRLAPEHMFPAQFDDCYLVTKTVANNPNEFDILNNKLALIGDSAGGLLSAAISHEFAQQNRSSELVAQVLIYPWLQVIDVLCLPSYQKNKQGFLLDLEQIAYFTSVVTMGNDQMKQAYLNGNITRYFIKTPFWRFLNVPETSKCKGFQDNTNYIHLPTDFINKVTDPHLSPLLADSLEGCPATLMVLAEYDSLMSENVLYAKRLEEAGVPTVSKIYKACHAFLQILPLSSFTNASIANQAVDDIAEFLNSAFYEEG